MNTLKDKYEGQTAWIVGKGPSLQHLSKSDIWFGPVIAINSAIIPVEELNLSNPVFSLQKDGGQLRGKVWRDKPHNIMYSPPCKFSGIECDNCKGVVRPKKATLLVHEHESKYCFPDYGDRIIFDYVDLGMPHNEYSLIVAVYIAKFMGCSAVTFVSCDAHSKGIYSRYEPTDGLLYGDSEYYYFQTLKLLDHLDEIHFSFRTPGEEVAA